MLDRDLSCPYNADASSEPALTVVTGATLDLNGHTVTCAGTREVGIRIEDNSAAVRNGTVRDCYTGVRITGSDNLVRRLTLIANSYGLAIERGTGNRIKASAARDGQIGFLVAGGNTLTGNTATGNDTGFHLNGGDNDPQALSVLIENEATGNGYGVYVGTVRVRLIQNRILRNGQDGVYVNASSGTLEGNRIANNQRNGIFCAYCNSLTVTDNKVIDNGGDGVLVDIRSNVDGPSPTLTNNRVLRNNHTGINVVGGAFTVFPATITGNRARGNQVDLADDAPNCAGGVWQGNSFQTASQTCIH